jgi:hypothetical protein
MRKGQLTVSKAFVMCILRRTQDPLRVWSSLADDCTALNALWFGCEMVHERAYPDRENLSDQLEKAMQKTDGVVISDFVRCRALP